MGLFDLFKKKDNSVEKPRKEVVTKTIPTSEKKFYQAEEYYSEKVYEGTQFEMTVVKFEERKKTAIPSNRGLYPAEILLLDYCRKGDYPEPEDGYPGFWWFAYGIRNVEAVLNDLENRGFIELATVKESIKSYTILQLKEILKEHGLPISGKKTDLVEKVKESISEDELIKVGVQRKYALTALGKDELEENAYVPYMHKAHNKTIENDHFGIQFNVWSINKLLGRGYKSNWKAVVDAQEQKMNKLNEEENDSLMENLKKFDPDGYTVLKTQDQQIEACQKAQSKYDEDKDIDYYIGFWEHLWANGGLNFEGSSWHFTLPDLYIKAKRYNDALEFCKKLIKIKPSYASKAELYITKIKKLIEKKATKEK